MSAGKRRKPSKRRAPSDPPKAIRDSGANGATPRPTKDSGRGACRGIGKGYLAAILLLPWAIVAWQLVADRCASPSEPAPVSLVPADPSTTLIGPWGEIEVVPIVTEPPEEHLAKFLRLNTSQWHFGDVPRQAIIGLFRSAGLGDAEVAELERSASGQAGQGWTFHPSEKLLLGMSPQQREVIYRALASDSRNLLHADPFRWRKENRDEWFAGSDMPDDIVQLVHRLCYHRGQSVMFSDLSLVLNRLSERDDRISLAKTLCRKPTMLVKLKIRPDTDIGKLEDYWGRGTRGKDIRPLLESLRMSHRVISIDAVHLLPRFARKRLYNYPWQQAGAGGPTFDCHWTTMNFWNDPPDNRYGGDVEYVEQSLNRDYIRVNDDYMFGDVLFFVTNRTQALHSAIYIAGDIVFTKNGVSDTSPWIFMDLSRLKAYYETFGDLEVCTYRLKEVPLPDASGSGE